MTITNEPGAELDARPDLVSVIVDGVAVSVPAGTLVIRAAEMLGIEIPPLLRPPTARSGCRLSGRA